MKDEIIKILLELFIISIIGGAITFYYNKLQKNREILLSLIDQISSVHSQFLSLRYKYNVLFTIPGKPISNILNIDEVNKLKWEYYEEACILISKFQSIKPLLLKFVPELKEEISMVDNYYQVYRRTIRSNQSIFQNENGKTDSAQNNLKKLYYELIQQLTNKI
ncbi:hypothetical protein B0A80_11685 [Flavobacterium tructae]|uniref:hypothetical protein n=1 Tax=Flavobacterium tructae TaxID=1114873 RepID=UPI000B5B6BA7|nr:hypothetical protein [Flavobacterium tructae]OXB23353.1 hypothetical protein B0A80_11685 [Flavobacterium tructae]